MNMLVLHRRRSSIGGGVRSNHRNTSEYKPIYLIVGGKKHHPLRDGV